MSLGKKTKTGLEKSPQSIKEEGEIEGLKADRERCEETIEKSLALATTLTSKIGYDEAARIAKKAYDQRKTIRQIVEEEGIFPKEELNHLFDPSSMTAPMKLIIKKM